MIEILYTSVFVALSSVALAVILRNAPVIRTLVWEMRKPWACNVCLPLYLCAIVVGGLWLKYHKVDVFMAYLPSYALTFIILEAMARPPRVVPELPDSE